MQLIRFAVSGQVPDTVIDFLNRRADVQVVSREPLEILAHDSVSFASIDSAVRNLGVDVRHVFLRRGLDSAAKKRAVV